MPGLERPPRAQLKTLDVLASGEVEVLGLLPFSSNYVFLARVERGGEYIHAVYKPVRGERPLWDFPSGTLAAREAAAFLVSESAGWHLVPATVLREELPLGPGSLQLFVEHDPERHYFVLVHEREPEELMRFAAFDIVINNADRKGGHLLEDRDGHLWGVDHGLTFNLEPKLRTVIWAFAHDPLPQSLCADLQRLHDQLGGAAGEELATLLSPAEATETRARTAMLLQEGRFPAPEGPFHMPWPLV